MDNLNKCKEKCDDDKKGEGIFYDGQIFDAYVFATKNIHDRFLIVDEDVYHIGASLKDLGKKLFAFSKMTVSKDLLTG